MSEDPKPDYEAPSVEQVDTEDQPAVTAAGVDSPPSDLRLKRSVRALGGKLSDHPKPDYEAPSVEQVDTEDQPAVTAAGADSHTDGSDLRLKRSLRPLEGTITQLR
jgi:hypothetical protein